MDSFQLIYDPEDDTVFEESMSQLKLVKINDQVRRLQTIIRDKYE